MPRPEQIEKYAPQIVISSIRERSRISRKARNDKKKNICNETGQQRKPCNKLQRIIELKMKSNNKKMV